MDSRVKVSAAGGVLRVDNDSPLPVRVFAGPSKNEAPVIDSVVSQGCTKEFHVEPDWPFEVLEAETLDDASGIDAMLAVDTPPAVVSEDPDKTAPPISAAQGSQEPEKSAETPSDVLVAGGGGAGDTVDAVIGSSLQPSDFPDIMVLIDGQDSIENRCILASALSAEESVDFRVLTLGDVVADAFDRARDGDQPLTVTQWNDLDHDVREKAIAETLDLIRAAATTQANQPAA